ncbi:MAG: GtrA family protein [Actinomycetota bacterium]|nr:GtrA family protein [Actinomycetota bacterium]
MHVASSVRHQVRVFVAELTKFGVIGMVNTALDFAILNLLHFGFGVGPLTSKCISTVIAATSSYFMNRHWTFAHRARSGMRREYTLFFLLNLVGLAIGLICIAVVRYGLEMDSPAAINAANLVGLVIGTVFRFWSYRRWVFLGDGHLAVEEQPDDSDEAIVVTPTG